MFLDADTVLEQNGLQKILQAYHQSPGPLSIQPYHLIKQPYENLSAFFNIILMMGSNLFTPLGSRLKPLVFFGPCQVIPREDYLMTAGNDRVKGHILEDIALGRAFSDRAVNIRCMGGRGAVNFRMYSGGIGEVIEGWSKNFASGAQAVGILNLLIVCLWIAGASGIAIMLGRTAAAAFIPELSFYIAALYLLYGLQIYWMLYRIGNFSPGLILFYPVALLFFVLVFFRALVMTFIMKKVRWKGREISTGN